MSLLINKHFIGFTHHALLDDDMLRWTNDFGNPAYCFGFDNSPLSLEPLLDLFSEPCPSLAPPEVINSFKECGYDYAPWSKVMPPKRFKKIFAQFISDIQRCQEKISASEYSNFFVETNRLFSYLRPSTISEARCRKLLKQGDNHSLKNILEMSRGNILPVPLYNRTSTKTGRLTIKGGPQILTLKKEFRTIFTPAKKGNKLYEIDFTSLEPRVALNIAGKPTGSDIYTSFSKERGLNVQRDISKLAILCSLYGAGTAKLDSVLRSSSHSISASALMKEVNEHFQITVLSKALRSQASEGAITNCFGRPIVVDEARDAILVNNFLQSSATDIALAGFLDFCEKLKDDVKPIFIIHDALIFEADPNKLDSVVQYINNGYELSEVGNFPLSISEFGYNG